MAEKKRCYNTADTAYTTYSKHKHYRDDGDDDDDDDDDDDGDDGDDDDDVCGAEFQAHPQDGTPLLPKKTGVPGAPSGRAPITAESLP